MNIQSLSVVVPNKNCVNNCAFCVSKMHCDAYKNQMDDNLPFFDLYLKDYLKRLEFARHNGCNTVMLTGNSEPQQNRKFLTYFGLFMQMMRDPFQWIEMQTTGVLLDANYLRFLRNHVGVNLISLSVSAPEDGDNMRVIGAPESTHFKLTELCQEIKKYDFSLRLSVNLTNFFDRFQGKEEQFFQWAKDLGADQVTCRVLYSFERQDQEERFAKWAKGLGADKEPSPAPRTDNSGIEQARWVRENAAARETIQEITGYVVNNGQPLGILPYGATKYSLHGMAVVVDDDCMAKGKLPGEEKDAYKYLILQPDCKLYSQWDDSASLIF